jgi:phage replication-related protein YjqB (UPF0714/DUF867 family)
MRTEATSFAELLAHPDVEERCVLRGTFGFMAFHGGNLERMTDEIAEVAAERANASVYTVVQRYPLRQHLPSIEVRPEYSTKLASFLDHVEVVIALHGFGRADMWTSVLLGGRNRELAERLANRLRASLPEFEILDDIATIPSDLAGQHPMNPVNRPPKQGVQIELPPRIRGLTPHAHSMLRTDGRIEWTNRLIDELVGLATEWAPVATSPSLRHSGE